MDLGAEANLIARCCSGESLAWDELFNFHYAATGRFVFQLSPDISKEDADEICQDVFLSVIRNLDSFHGKCQLQTWIFRIASNKAFDYLERQRAAKRGGGVVPISLQAENPETGRTLDPASSLAGPDLTLLKAENIELVGYALEQMDRPCRDVIELRYFGDSSYEEISRELQLNVKTVSSRLSKCLDKLEKIVRASFCGKKTTPFPV
jgi:RNA polymerase sigma-70 factor (ECF subfamily)